MPAIAPRVAPNQTTQGKPSTAKGAVSPYCFKREYRAGGREAAGGARAEQDFLYRRESQLIYPDKQDETKLRWIHLTGYRDRRVPFSLAAAPLSLAAIRNDAPQIETAGRRSTGGRPGSTPPVGSTRVDEGETIPASVAVRDFERVPSRCAGW